MSEEIHHECGIAFIRLRKPLSYYITKYGSSFAMNKMYILMEKQHNRGQDGAGIATIKINQSPGYRFFSRYRSMKKQPVEDLFRKIGKKFEKGKKEGGALFKDEQWLKENVAFMGEVWLGHLRYGTYGKNSIENVHPFLRQSNWRSRNLVMAGNFNMTNVEALFQKLVDLGQHPKEKVDTVTVMEKIGHFLDMEVQQIFEKYKDQYNNREVSELIESEMNLGNVLRKACKDFDGGYTMAGLTGSGSSFIVRDPSGIRPAYFYADEEIIVAASEKPAIQTAFQIAYNQIQEIKPGHALVVKKNGDYSMESIIPELPKTSCSFERLYFSRGNDPEIYHERKQLGKLLVPQVLRAVNFDLKNAVFSYIPNTAELAFLGMMAGLNDFIIQKQHDYLIDQKPTLESTEEILSFRPRVEKIIWKDAKMRTFITDDLHRNEMVAHAYDSTFEAIQKNRDTLVVLDDSIVRGTTLENSILKMLARLEPKKVVIVSSAPQIRYPDCYGIDMSRLGDFIAFRALQALLKETNQEALLDETYQQCIQNKKDKKPINFVKNLYEQFSDEQLSKKIAQIVHPPELKADLQIEFQSVENLHKAIPHHSGDWYFTGNYPTPGGMQVANQAFINFMEKKKGRSYS